MKLLLLLILLVGNVADAAPITFSYSGLVTRMFEADCLPASLNHSDGYKITDVDTSYFYPGLAVSLGDPFKGVLTYNTEAFLSGISDDGYQAIYSHGITDHQMMLNSFRLPNVILPSVGAGSLSIVNNRNGTDVFQTSSFSSNSDWFSSITLSLQDRSGLVFNGMNIPDNLSQDDFSYLGFRLAFLEKGTKNQLHISGHIENLHLTPVPITSSLWFFICGLIILIYAHRIKKQDSPTPITVSPNLVYTF